MANITASLMWPLCKARFVDNRASDVAEKRLQLLHDLRFRSVFPLIITILLLVIHIFLLIVLIIILLIFFMRHLRASYKAPEGLTRPSRVKASKGYAGSDLRCV